MGPCESLEVQQGQVLGPAHGSGETQAQIQAGRWIESSLGEKYLGVFVEEKLNMTQQGMLTAQKANSILGSIKNSVASQLRGVVLYSALRRPYLWVPSTGKCRPVGTDTEEGYECDHLCCEDRLKVLGLFRLEQRSSGETALGHIS